MKKPAKYEKLLQLVERKRIITLKVCREKHPEISSGTFHSIMNKLSKRNLVKKKVLPDKRRVAYQKTSKYTMEKGREILEVRRTLAPTNPVLTMALYSLLNALEFFQGLEERHRQATIILMDLSVEYTLKAKLYEVNQVKFIEDQLGRLDFFAALREIKKNRGISRADEVKLTRIHNARNYVQHRAVISDSPSTRQYMEWVYEFIRRFSSKNFGLDINSQIPSSLLAHLNARTHTR